MRYLIFDASNLLHKTFYAHKTEDDITLSGLASHAALTTMNKYFKKFQPQKIIMVFDRPSWRIDYTKSPDCVSGLLYKGERRKKQTPAERERYAIFKKHIEEFEILIKENTSIITLAKDKLEADDIISGCTQIITLEEDNEVIIVSADKDFMQLLRYDNVYLVDPATGNERTLEDFHYDADYFMFEKCFRGEGGGGDNVQSAYPRLRKNKIEEAYKDSFAKSNLMNHKWTHPVSKKEFVVKDLFKENQLLMDLEKQPDYISKKIFKTVQKGLKDKTKFNFVKFMQYCNKHGLKSIVDGLDKYTDMMSL